MFDEEKCPFCGCEDYKVDDYWDNFDEEGGERVWECTCSDCRRKYEITYAYTCTRITVS
jgi:hypothetical protein